MQTILFLAAIALTKPSFSDAPIAFDVQLDNPAYASIVKNSFQGKRIPFRLVKEAQQGVPSIKIEASHQKNSSCTVRVTVDTPNMSGSRYQSKSWFFTSRSQRLPRCQKVLASILEDTLRYF